MDSIKKNKVVDTIWITIYFLLTIALVISAVVVFNNLYYSQIYVSGGSMRPTFNKIENEPYVDYGYVDKHDSIKKQIKRFQIVVTHYPEDTDETDYKIKRVWVLPGETFKIIDNNLYLLKNDEGKEYWSDVKVPFERNFSGSSKKTYNHGNAYTLKDNEYFVAGDNWAPGMSDDSFRVGPVTFSLLVGVVTKMCGYCKVNKTYNKETRKYDISLVDKKPYEDGKEHYFLGVDY